MQDNGLNRPEHPKHMGAKSRWIMQGFTDPDISLLNRTVPTPTTEDVFMALQLIASIGGNAGVSDVSAAFGQSLKGQRSGKRLFANPPPEGLPGEDDDILIELLTEVYGLVSGPPGWRKTLLSKFKDLAFARHPLAPCVVLMYETIGGKPKTLSGLVVIETDDLLFGGVGPKYLKGIEALRKSFT